MSGSFTRSFLNYLNARAFTKVRSYACRCELHPIARGLSPKVTATSSIRATASIYLTRLRILCMNHLRYFEAPVGHLTEQGEDTGAHPCRQRRARAPDRTNGQPRERPSSIATWVWHFCHKDAEKLRRRSRRCGSSQRPSRRRLCRPTRWGQEPTRWGRAPCS